MTTPYKPGDIAICQMCTEKIQFVDPHWQHIGTSYGMQPRHPAWPREPVPEPQPVAMPIGDNRIATPKAGDRTICFCDEEIVYTGQYWDHVGLNKPRHIAAPKDEMPEDEDRILVDSGILPKLIAAGLKETPSANWQQELADLPTSEPQPIENSIRNMTTFTRLIASELAGMGVHQADCDQAERDIHRVWSSLLRTANRSATNE